MININVEYKHNYIKCIEVSGHANFDEKGKDIVCSAVSAIIIGGINEVFKITKEANYIVNDGYAKIELTKENDKIQIVLETILTQFLTIEESYGKFIKITKKYGGA